MARLNIEQVQGPNMSAAGNMLAQAGQSLDRGLEAASGLLAKYQEGQQASGDQAILAQMAQVKDENQLAAFLSSPELASANLSDDMRQSVLGLRDNVIGYDQGRANVRQTNANTGLIGANTRNVDARTAIANAAEGRDQSDWVYGNRRRDEQTALAGSYAAALAEGQQYGNTGGPSAGGDVQSQVYEGLLARGMPEHVAQGFMMNFQDESGFDHDITEAEANVHGTFGKGLYQLTGPRRDAYEARFGNDYSIDNQLDWLMEELNGSERRAADLIFSSTNAGEAGAAIVNEFLRPAKEHRISRTQRYTNGSYTPPARNSVGQVTENRQMTPAAQALMAAMANGSTFTMEDVNTAFAGLNGATDRGQTQIDAAEATRVADASAQGILEAARNPDILSASGVGNTAANNPALSPSQQLATAVQGTELAQGPLAGIVAPSVAVDPLVAAQAASDQRVRDREIEALPQTSLMKTADRYAGDAVGGLIADLGLGEDGENNQTYVFGLFGGTDDNQLRLHIKDIAARAGVSEEMAAAGMADQFKRDPWGPNTQNARFDPDQTVAYLKETVGPEGMRAYEDALVQNETRTGRNEAAQIQLSALQSQLSKATDPRQRSQLQAQVNQTKDQLLADATPAEARQMMQDYIRGDRVAATLRASEPGSLEYGKAVEDLRQKIEMDDSLSAREKSLLISQLPS